MKIGSPCDSVIRVRVSIILAVGTLLLGCFVSPSFVFAVSKKQEAFRFLFTGQERLIQDALESTKKGRNSFLYEKKFLGGILPHHAPLTFPLIARFYKDLRFVSPDIETFVIVGPDHFNRATHDIVVSPLAFQTPYGTLTVDQDILTQIVKGGFAQKDKKLFTKEHAIQSHTVFIKRFFPHARIIAIAFKASARFDQAKALGVFLQRNIHKKIFVLASVDFSHYLQEKEARKIDTRSAEIISRLSLSDVPLIDVDSPAALTMLFSYIEGKKRVRVLHQEVYNTADFSSNYTNTTGYITAIIGIHK